MSYKDNIRRTQIELAVSVQRQSSWPPRMKASLWARLDKLHKYSRRVGNNVFDDVGTPENMGANVGYAGKKLKAKMLEQNTFHLGKKRPKVYRRNLSVYVFRNNAGPQLIHRGAVPTLPEGGLGTDLIKHVLVAHNNKKGFVEFFWDNGASVKVPYVIDKTKSPGEIASLWDPLTRLTHSGETVPFFAPPRFGRQAPVRSMGEAAAVRTGDL